MPSKFRAPFYNFFVNFSIAKVQLETLKVLNHQQISKILRGEKFGKNQIKKGVRIFGIDILFDKLSVAILS